MVGPELLILVRDLGTQKDPESKNIVGIFKLLPMDMKTWPGSPLGPG